MEAVSVSNYQVKKIEIVCPQKCVLTAPWWPAAVPNDGSIPTIPVDCYTREIKTTVVVSKSFAVEIQTFGIKHTGINQGKQSEKTLRPNFFDILLRLSFKSA